MKNKIFCWLIALVVSTYSTLADAQQPGKMYRIGILSPRAGLEPAHEVFRQRLRELGYIEGQNIVIEWRFWEGKPDLLNKYVAELVGLKVDVIFGNNTASIQAAKKATMTIPIVMQLVGDPVESGLIASLERPGGNVTGLTSGSPVLYSKRMELLKEIVPQFSRLGVLVEPAYIALTNSVTFRQVEAAAAALELKMQPLEVRVPNDFEGAFQVATKTGTQGIIHMQHPLINTERKRITALALKHKLPAVYADTPYIDAGGLMSFGADPLELARQAAECVDKILKGAKPADMPIGQPTKFELVINNKVAQQIELTIPPSVLARADKVIR